MDIHISFIAYRSCKKNKEGVVGVIMIRWKNPASKKHHGKDRMECSKIVDVK